MKKVITTVGTSIFENYFKTMKNIRNLYDNIKDKSFTEDYEAYQGQANKIKDEVLKFYKTNYTEDISAEIKTINKIKANLKEELEIYLIASDTINSYIAAEILKELLKQDYKVHFNKKHDVIKDLQVKDKDRFVNEGLPNLIQRIENIAVGNVEESNFVGKFSSDGCYNNVIFNISGGYKATIPHLTMIAQINGSDLYYIFEETEELITIPSVPITINMELFDEYAKQFKELEDGIDNYSKWKEENYVFVQKASSCIQVADNIADLSTLGTILWRNYKTKNVYFFATDEVIRKIESNKILAEKVIKFMNKETRDSKTEKKGVGNSKHFVFDDGNNDYRIIYYEKGEDVYIYKIFDDEEEQVKYLKDPNNKPENYNPNIYCSINRATKELERKS